MSVEWKAKKKRKNKLGEYFTFFEGFCWMTICAFLRDDLLVEWSGGRRRMKVVTFFNCLIDLDIKMCPPACYICYCVGKSHILCKKHMSCHKLTSFKITNDS